MTMQELQQQVLRLSASDCWQLIQWILSLLKRDSLDPAPTSPAIENNGLENLPPATSNFAQPEFDKRQYILSPNPSPKVAGKSKA